MLQNKISVCVFTIMLACLTDASVSAQTLRDPTRPGAAAITGSGQAQTGQKLILSSVLVADQGATAIINNKMFTLGDRVQGVKITRITEQGVWLADGRHLKLYPAVTETKGQ